MTLKDYLIAEGAGVCLALLCQDGLQLGHLCRISTDVVPCCQCEKTTLGLCESSLQFFTNLAPFGTMDMSDRTWQSASASCSKCSAFRLPLIQLTDRGA